MLDLRRELTGRKEAAPSLIDAGASVLTETGRLISSARHPDAVPLPSRPRDALCTP